MSAIENALDLTLSGQTGTGAFVGAHNASLISANLQYVGGASLQTYTIGTWTPADGSGASLTFTVNFAHYVQLGQIVLFNLSVTYPVTANGSAASISGLPYAALAQCTVGPLNTGAVVTGPFGLIAASGTSIAIYSGNNSTVLNSTLTTATVILSGSYIR